MIYDKRAELARYFGLSPNLDAAIRFLQTTDLTALPMGRTEIPGGDIYYNHFTYTTALISQASLFEAHERYLDLHIVLSGCEQVALAPVESLDEAEVRADEDSTMYRVRRNIRLRWTRTDSCWSFPVKGTCQSSPIAFR